MASAKYKKNSRGFYETKIWDGTYNTDGSKHRKIISSKKSSADLERKVLEFKDSIKNQGPIHPTAYTFGEYALHWLDVRKGTKEINTQAMYQNIINVHLKPISHLPLASVMNSHIQQCINMAADKPRTCQQIYLTAKQIMRMALCDFLIGQNQFQIMFTDISLPKYIKAEKRALTQIEKDAIPQADFSIMEKTFVYLIYGCGLRRGEALALTKFDINLKESTLSVTKTVVFNGNQAVIKNMPKTGNGIRTVPIPTATLAVLNEYLPSLQTTQLFVTRGGALITKSSYVKMWKRIVSKINLAAGGSESFPVVTDLTAHIFRHNYCSNLCYQVPSISIKKIAQLMGDTEKVVLDVYNHIIEEKENVIDVVEAALAL